MGTRSLSVLVVLCLKRIAVACSTSSGGEIASDRERDNAKLEITQWRVMVQALDAYAEAQAEMNARRSRIG
jgi:hypothetical protein